MVRSVKEDRDIHDSTEAIPFHDTCRNRVAWKTNRCGSPTRFRAAPARITATLDVPDQQSGCELTAAAPT
jgi:hypothetical protein